MYIFFVRSNSLKLVFARLILFSLVTALQLIFTLFSFSKDSTLPTVQTIIDEFPNRQTQCLEEIANHVMSSTYEQGAALLLLKENIPKANTLLREFNQKKSDILDCSVLMRILRSYSDSPQILYHETRRQLETQIRHYIEREWNSLTKFRTDSHTPISHIVLSQSLLLLWSDQVESSTSEYKWPDNQSNTKHRETILAELNSLFDLWGQYGFGERGSPYTLHILAALLNVRDCYPDDTIRTKADAMADLLVADIAQESVGGLWGGVRRRSFEAITPLPGSRLLFLFFGQKRIFEQEEQIDPLTFIWSHTQYCIPAVLVRIGYERENRGEYEVKTRFYLNRKNPENSGTGRKYSFVTPTYILSSFYLRNEQVPNQTRPWDLLVWDQKGEGNHLFLFCGNQLFSGGYPPYTDSYYLWNATCLQYKNVLFCKFHRSDKKKEGSRGIEEPVWRRFEYLPTRAWIQNSFIPIVQETDWCFAQAEGIYLAFRSLSGRNYWWRTAVLENRIGTAAAIMGFLELDTGFLFEIEDADHFSSFDDFKEQVLNAPLQMDKESVTFVSRNGDVFLFPMDQGKFLVNGEPVDPLSDPTFDLFSSPFTHSAYGSGFYEFEWAPFSHTIDLRDSGKPLRRSTIIDHE